MDAPEGVARATLVRLRELPKLLEQQGARLNAHASTKTVLQLGADSCKAAPPAASLLEMVHRRIVAAAGSPAGLASIERRDVRHAPWLLWHGSEPLAAMPGLLDRIVTRADTSLSTRRNLIDAWLRGFDRDAPGLEAAGHAIRHLLADPSDARLERWRAADRTFALFDPRRGPAWVADAVANGTDTVEEVLRRTGLDEPLRGVGGYARAVQGEVCARLPAAIRSGSASRRERLWSFLAPAGSLRFREPAMAGAVADAALSAWLTQDPPGDAARADVQTFLLRHLGDPRIRPDSWKHVAEGATRVFRGWLARASLNLFFDLISDHALDEHFRYRKAFWSACLRMGAIDDVWLALGVQVRQSASGINDLKGAYGRLEGARVAGNQSILIIRMGPLILGEWSHNGKLRAWPTEAKNAPRLNLLSYSRSDVTGLGLPFPPDPRTGRGGASDGKGLAHIGSDVGYWQASAAELLRQKLGLHLGPQDWLPK